MNEYLRVVEIKLKEIKQKNKKLICGCVLDEMCIRNNGHFSDIQLLGYIHFGQGSNNSDGLFKVKKIFVL